MDSLQLFLKVRKIAAAMLENGKHSDEIMGIIAAKFKDEFSQDANTQKEMNNMVILMACDHAVFNLFKDKYPESEFRAVPVDGGFAVVRVEKADGSIRGVKFLVGGN